MKNFFKYDFYFQITIFVVISTAVLIDLFVGNEKLIFLFYFGIGISQTISYLIRHSYDYKKSLIFKIYGYLILPIFPSLIFIMICGNINILAGIFIIIPILSCFYSPVLAIAFLIDCYQIMVKTQSKKLIS